MVALVPNRGSGGSGPGRHRGTIWLLIQRSGKRGTSLAHPRCDPDRGLSRTSGSSRTRMAPPSVRATHLVGRLPGGRARERKDDDAMSLFSRLLQAVRSWRPRRAQTSSRRAGVAVECLDHRQLLSVTFTGNVPVDFPASQSPGVVVIPADLSNPYTKE